MKSIKELLNILCPGGVEFKPLWSLTAWDKKFNAVDRDKQKKVIDYHYFLAGELKPLIRDGGNVKILTTSITNLFTDESLVEGFVSEGEIVCLPWGGTPVIQYYCGRFVTADNRIATSLNTDKLRNKFLYYYLSNRIEEISTFYRGSGIKHPDMARVLDLLIPVPPVQIQDEIIRLLDEYSSLTKKIIEKISLELLARKKQYEFYTNHCIDSIEGKTILLGDYFEIKTGKGITKKDADDSGDYPIISGGKEPMGFYKYSNRDGNIVTISRVGANAGYVMYHEKKIYLNDKCFSVIPYQQYSAMFVPKFVYYALKNKENDIVGMQSEGGVPTINTTKVNSISIIVPSVPEQNKIVAILDEYCSAYFGISKKLALEKEKRQSQFDCYCNQLLSFKELKN